MKNIVKGLMVAVIGLCFTMGNANAADCKGKSATACSASNSCSWVKGYKRKDGVSVSAHCRVSAKKSALDKKKNAKAKVKNTKAKVKSKTKDAKMKAKSKVKSKASDAKSKIKDKK